MMHTAFFGDGEHTFALPANLILELEKTTSAAIGVLFSRVLARQFAYADLVETIRLGLIGGGATPKDAKHLVTVYGEQRPIAEMIPVALGILSHCYFGPDVADHDAARTGDLAAAISEAA
jgi:hypothetical protein